MSMPIFSSPNPFVNGPRPTATKTTSACKLSFLPPTLGSIVRFTFCLVALAPVTLVAILNFIPCFVRMRRMFSQISASMPGRIASRYSITVTSAPNRRHTEPSSRPITPAPMTAKDFGTFDKERAPVEETIRFSSIITPLSGVTFATVAIMISVALSIFFRAPFLFGLNEIRPGSVISAIPK